MHLLLRKIDLARHFATTEVTLNGLAHLPRLRFVTGLVVDHVLHLRLGELDWPHHVALRGHDGELLERLRHAVRLQRSMLYRQRMM